MDSPKPDPLEEMLRQLPPCGASPHLPERILRAWQERRRARAPRRGLLLAALLLLVPALALFPWRAGRPGSDPDSTAAILREYDLLRQELAALRDLGAGDRSLVSIDDNPDYDILLSLNKNNPEEQPTCFYRPKTTTP